MNISEHDLKRQANVWIKDDYLKKFRWYDENPNSIIHILHEKSVGNKKLTRLEIMWIIANKDRIIIESGNTIKLIKFNYLNAYIYN